MLSVPSTHDICQVKDAYAKMRFCVEAVTTANKLKEFPSRPIDLENKRKAKRQSEALNADNGDAVFSVVLKSSFFKNLRNAPSFVQLKLFSNGLCVISYVTETELETKRQIDLDKFFSHCSDGEAVKYIDALSDLDLFYKRMDSEKEFEFYELVISMTSEDISKVLRYRKLGKYKDFKEHKRKIAFYPTVIDIARIYDEVGEDEIPTKVLVSADRVDSRPSSYVSMSSAVDETVSQDYANMAIGQRLAERIRNAKHRESADSPKMVSFPSAKTGRMRVIDKALGGDVGNIVFNLRTDSKSNASIGKVGGVGGSTIITDNGLFIGFTKNEMSVTTAYFGSPTDLVNCVAKSNGVMSNSRYGSSHTTASIPTELLMQCVDNEVNGWVCLDNRESDDSGNANCRRYVEAYD